MKYAKITDNDSWPGIFLNETEAAKALEFGQLPARILEDPRVAQSIRDRAAADPEEKRELLILNRMDIAFWEGPDAIEDGWTRMSGEVHIDVHRNGILSRNLNTLADSFRMSISGRSYTMEELGDIQELVNIAYRIMHTASFNIQGRLMSRKELENK